MATVHYFEDLRIWQEARSISKWFVHVVQKTELKRDFKLKNQADASSGSVMDNIAEGFERNGKIEYIQFLTIAKGSCGEFRSQLYRIYDREYISEDEFNTVKEKVLNLGKGISSFINYLKKSDKNGWKFMEANAEYITKTPTLNIER